MYYIFEKSLEENIKIAMLQKQGEGFYDFKPHQKCEKITDIPSSNTDSTPINFYRTVIALETNFAPEDALLQAQAEALAEYYTDKPLNFHKYLSLPDSETVGKNKEQLDVIIQDLN